MSQFYCLRGFLTPLTREKSCKTVVSWCRDGLTLRHGYYCGVDERRKLVIIHELICHIIYQKRCYSQLMLFLECAVKDVAITICSCNFKCILMSEVLLLSVHLFEHLKHVLWAETQTERHLPSSITGNVLANITQTKSFRFKLVKCCVCSNPISAGRQ